MSALTDKLIERLAMLACGAEPRDEIYGICYDVECVIGEDAASALHGAFEYMGLCSINPLGTGAYNNYGLERAWSGDLGRRRRKLCRDAVYTLVRMHGYNGEWA